MRKDTEKCIKEFQIKTFGNVKNIERAESLVDVNEDIKYISPTNITITSTTTLKKDTCPGVIILTSKRILFYFQILNNNHTEILLLPEIKAIESSGNSLTGGHIIIHSISNDYDFLVTYKRNIIQKILNIFDTVRINSSESFSPQANIRSEADEILKFKTLLDQGIITEEEFMAKKKQLLGL